MSVRQVHIAISGGIAVGKTTLAGELSRLIPDCQCFIEKPETNDYLALFYDDMKKWAFHSRIGMLAQFVERYEKIDSSKKLVLFDRCIHELVTFARLHYDAGNLSEPEFSTYQSIYNGLVTLTPGIDTVIYLECASSVAIARIQKRKRSFEANVEPEYLANIERYYDQWISALPITTCVLKYNTDNGIQLEQIHQDLLQLSRTASTPTKP